MAWRTFVNAMRDSTGNILSKLVQRLGHFFHGFHTVENGVVTHQDYLRAVVFRFSTTCGSFASVHSTSRLCQLNVAHTSSKSGKEGICEATNSTHVAVQRTDNWADKNRVRSSSWPIASSMISASVSLASACGLVTDTFCPWRGQQ